MSIDGGQLKPIGSNFESRIRSYSWFPDGSGLVLTFRDGKNPVKVSFPDGDVSSITNDNNKYFGTSLTADSKTLVSIQNTNTSGIWEFDIDNQTGKQISANSNFSNGIFGLDISTGNKIVFTRTKNSQTTEIVQMASDTSNEMILAISGVNKSPTYSSDGDYIYFESYRDGTQDIWRTRSDGTNQVKITNTNDVSESILGISSDNKILFYSELYKDSYGARLLSVNTETFEIKPIYDDDSLSINFSALSEDTTEFVYFATSRDPSPIYNLYKAKIADLEIKENSVFKRDMNANNFVYMHFSPDNRYLFYIDNAKGSSDIWKLDLANGKSIQVTNFNLETIFNFNISPDGRKLYIVRGNTTDEVVLIKNVE